MDELNPSILATTLHTKYKLSPVMALSQWLPVLIGKSFTARNGGPTWAMIGLWAHLCKGGEKWATQWPTKAILQLIPNTAILLSAWRCTYPPPSLLLFLQKTPQEVTSQEESFMLFVVGFIIKIDAMCTPQEKGHNLFFSFTDRSCINRS